MSCGVVRWRTGRVSSSTADDGARAGAGAAGGGSDAGGGGGDAGAGASEAAAAATAAAAAAASLGERCGERRRRDDSGRSFVASDFGDASS